MSVFQQALAWLNDPLNWTGHDGVLALTKAHVIVSVLAVLLAAVVSLPVALWLGHRRRGSTVGVVVGFGGLGQLMFRGFRSNYHAEIMTATVLCLVLAFVFDMLIAFVGHRLTPWARTAETAKAV